MSSIRFAFAIAAACCAFSTFAQAEDVYLGNATVRATGSSPAACTAHPIKMAVDNGHFTYGNPVVAEGPVASDGSFKATFSSNNGVGGRVQVEIALTGTVRDGKAVGTTSATSGCIQDFTATKH